ncbi:hypothetical protein CC1G_07414 [Coprinopsis cinerea okayama7|uniref:THO1-MOS11 C-terminal domain-containing protein n=1 Tax=Coprinopsis cinerea (strain Okayama-7 / 130 / ATCC MYA-4618 / FGSC 9003) TaxID=240176 RepID=A8N6P3_COPC7|nr:hypothetical protein CC1G_07414 [Coprinopsis cinerea okayama7\|eukprot:XP_001830499.1 hypothetical protein CC1G_07414 [Coprinopsis cinerea okayama7\
MDAKLKALKVADLKAILTKAGNPAPAKATKADLVSRILASDNAQEAYRQLHEPQLEQHDTVDASNDAPVEEEEEEEQPPPAEEAEQVEEAQPEAAETCATEATAVDPELEARKRRAERFGIPLVEPKAPRTDKGRKGDKPKITEDPAKLQARAERFGIKRPAPEETVDPEEAERRRKRAERFGIPLKE